MLMKTPGLVRWVQALSLLWLIWCVGISADVLSRDKTVHSLYSPQLTGKREMTKPPILKEKGLVVIDAGHGGEDVGTQSLVKPRCQEKTLNLTTARFVRDYLQQLGYRVMMTREEDVFVSLEKRAQWTNAHAPVIFVSIHYNSAPNAEAHGIEVFFFQSVTDKVRSNKSKRLAQVVLKHVLAQTEAKSRGVKHGDYAVIRETQMPAILIEGGFITNEQEAQRLRDSAYLKKLALGVAKGIEEYLKRNAVAG